jgi:FXSXX-COOH protein
LNEATTKLGPCQVRSKTEQPCLRRAEVEILGVAFCEPCAREQEAYFAVGELTQEKHGLRNKALAEALGRMRRERNGGREDIAA